MQHIIINSPCPTKPHVFMSTQPSCCLDDWLAGSEIFVTNVCKSVVQSWPQNIINTDIMKLSKPIKIRTSDQLCSVALDPTKISFVKMSMLQHH